MDIVTHAGIGLIAASPFLSSRPELAMCIVAGSVLPDLDAVCRLAGKRAFLRAHQTWTHALPVQLAASVASGIVSALGGWHGIEVGTGLLAGLTIHSLLDMSNTFGVAWFAPFSRRRICLEWVFFIDTIVLVALAGAFALMTPLWLGTGEVPISYAAVSLAIFSAYFLGKGSLRQRAGSFCPNAKSLVPSALFPWRFFGTERRLDSLTLFRVNALTGARAPVIKVKVLDDAFAGSLEPLPEFDLMREMSPAYHVVRASSDGSGTRLLCRDMRLRNFGTRFGDLEVWLDANRKVVRNRFYV